MSVQEATSHRTPARLHMDTAASDSADAAIMRQFSPHFTGAPPNKMRSRRLSTQTDSESSGTDTVTSEDATAGQERHGRQRIPSSGMRGGDPRARPPATSYPYVGERISEWQPAGLTLPVTSGSEVSNPSMVRYAPDDTSGQFDSRDVLLPYPPGLERYPQNFQDNSMAATNSIPRRRRSDGDQVPMNSTRSAVVDHVRASSTPPTRGVRWNENLICPSPVPPSQRRKGWYNRRGCVMLVPFHR